MPSKSGDRDYYDQPIADLESKLRPLAESLLAPGETVLGTCVASQQTTFKGWMVAIVVTEDRLLLQKLTRKFDPDGEPLSLTYDQIAEARVGGAGGLSSEPTALIMDKVAVELKLKTTDGQKLKLRMMSGEGPMGIGKLGGGEIQEQGVRSIGEWFDRLGGG